MSDSSPGSGVASVPEFGWPGPGSASGTRTAGSAGGGVKRGLVYGKSNATCSEPEEDPLTVEDWATTIYGCMGIVADKELMAPGDRPIEIVDGGNIRRELLA